MRRYFGFDLTDTEVVFNPGMTPQGKQLQTYDPGPLLTEGLRGHSSSQGSRVAHLRKQNDMSAEIVLTYIAYPSEGELERICSVMRTAAPTPESVMFSLAHIDGAEECLAFPVPEPGFPRTTPEVALAGLHAVNEAIQAE